MDRRTFLGALLTTSLTACASGRAGTPFASPVTASTAPSSAAPIPAVTSAPAADDLARAAAVKVFFGHQSVGRNIIKGVNALFKGPASGLTIVELTDAQPEPPAGEGGYLAHAKLGKNEDPYGKIEDFDAMVRGGLGDVVEVGLMKLCYVDVTAGTQVTALFDAYRDTLTALERDFTRVRFLHATVPLTTAQTENNVLREEYNALLRREYGAAVYDLAALESTAPDGSRVGGRDSAGHQYFQLYEAYTSDGGHLNTLGARVAALPLLRLIAESG